jgi:DNA invertase Pin-like site-specific DNA recombinase
MRIVAYLYSDPLLEAAPDPAMWGWDCDRVYQDLGQRQQLLQLIEDCNNEPVDYLLIRRWEELGDTLEEVRDRLLQLESLQIKIVAIEQDSTTLKGELFQLAQEIQKYQRSHRLRQGQANRRLKSLPPPGKPPYGYRRGKDKYILDRSAAPLVKDFFERFLIYGSLRGAVRYIEKKYGKKISVSTGKRWLTNPVYRGDTAYQNHQILSNTHIPIISREEAAQIDRLLRRNRRLPRRTASAPRSLAGLVVCGECFSSMSVACVTTPGQNKEYLYLRPISCTNRPKCKAIPYEQILTQTIKTICNELPQAIAQINAPDMKGIKETLKDAIAFKENILDQLGNLTQTGILDEETAALRTYKLRSEISQLQGQLAQLPPVNLRETAQAVSIPQFWLDLSESERRFYLREFIRQIQLIRHQGGWELQLQFIF